MSTILQNLLRVYETNKSDPFLQYGIAIEYRNAGDLVKALEFFTRVHNDFPNYIPNYYHYAQALVASGRESDATLVFHEGIGVASRAGDAHAVSELQRELAGLRV